jgi:transitional endoplasmic reticulum ATPase
MPYKNIDDSNVSDTLPDVREFLAKKPLPVREALKALGEILNGVEPEEDTAEVTPDGFLKEHLGAARNELVCESQRLSNVGHVTVGLQLADMLDRHPHVLGPAQWGHPPRWESFEIGEDHFPHPAEMSVFFAPGQLCRVGIVVRLSEGRGFGEKGIEVYVCACDQADGRALLGWILETATREKNILRGRVLRASLGNGLTFDVLTLPPISRAEVIVPEDVWFEIDLNVASVTIHRTLMQELGLGVRRGILLAGPPGVGKSVISQVVARELAGEFTVIFVDSRVGMGILIEIYKEAVKLGPTVVILEDIDLFIADRRTRFGDNSRLWDFLAAMDSDPAEPILTVASTNDASTLDAAAIRSARFDSIINIGYPTPSAAQQILGVLLRDVPGGDSVAVQEVVTAFTPETSGADIREIVRRTVLSSGGAVSTEALIHTVSTGRFKPQLPQGNYL